MDVEYLSEAPISTHLPREIAQLADQLRSKNGND